MAITVVSEPGPTANSYASVQAYKDLLTEDPNKDISTQTDDDIAYLVTSATTQIDFENQDNLEGNLYNESYSLLFTRTGLKDYRGISIEDYSVFPDQLIKATIYQAWHVSQVNYYEIDTPISGVKSKKMEGLGSIENFGASEQRKSLKKQKWGKEVPQYLNSFLLSPIGQRSISNIMSRG